MAFQPLPLPTRGKSAGHHDDITFSVSKPVSGRPVTMISFPREILRDADLPDYPGAKIDLLVGSGSDLGSVCIQAGTRHTLRAVPYSKGRVSVCFTGLAADKFRTTRTTSVAGIKSLIVHVPPAFPWNAATLVETTAPAATEPRAQQFATAGAAA